jgi:pentose-5-phosphate-3-epimerase
VGLFDPANNTATFVIDMIWVMTLEPGGGGASNLTQVGTHEDVDRGVNTSVNQHGEWMDPCASQHQ